MRAWTSSKALWLAEIQYATGIPISICTTAPIEPIGKIRTPLRLSEMLPSGKSVSKRSVLIAPAHSANILRYFPAGLNSDDD